MELNKAFDMYIKEANFFAPDYNQENESLNAFKKKHPALTDLHVDELVKFLYSDSTWKEKYFAADLLYLYVPFPSKLLSPMILCAIEYEDPSFNRIFLNPCIASFGLKIVASHILELVRSDPERFKVGAKRLIYWLHRDSDEDVAPLLLELGIPLSQ